MKKNAFSYFELIIAMTLVVVIAILTAPFMTSMGRKSTPVYGEFKCYARLVGDTWKLFQNERINTDTYPEEDTEIAEGRPCKFSRPAGNISSYTVTLHGGGGSGSMPYFVVAKSDSINFAPGQEGIDGDKKSVSDSLSKAFDTDGTLSIYLCDQNSDKNCIGKGGEVNAAQSSMAPKERIEKIRNNLKQGGDISAGDVDYINNTNCSNVKTRMEAYRNNKNNSAKKQNFINSLNESCYNSIADKSKYTGNSGQSTRLLLSSGKHSIALGGTYGISDKYASAKAYQMSELTNAGNNNLYYYPVTANPSIIENTFRNCNGSNANNPTEADIFEDFGKGGGGGAFACKIKDEDNLNLLNTKGSLGNYINVNFGTTNTIRSVDNQCYLGYGGAGAGGAIIIQWN